MDYAAGGEMFDYIVEAHRLPEPCARYFFQQLVSALAWCHKNVRAWGRVSGRWSALHHMLVGSVA